jgi:hypothetical protein
MSLFMSVPFKWTAAARIEADAELAAAKDRAEAAKQTACPNG